MPVTPEKLESLASACLPLVRSTGWIARWKQKVDYIEPGLLRHSLTLDVDISDQMWHGDGCFWIPVTTLPKTPGQLFRFDFCDGSGRTIPLRTSGESREISAALITEAVTSAVEIALKELSGNDEGVLTNEAALLETLRDETALMAIADSQQGQEALKNLWGSRDFSPPWRRWLKKLWQQGPFGRPSDPGSVDDLTRVRQHLRANDTEFWDLLKTVAHSSFVIAPVRAAAGERVVLKLSYDQVFDDITVWKKDRSLNANLRSFSFRSGFRAIPLKVFVPWSASKGFHFEAHVASGLSVSHAGVLPAGVVDVDHAAHAHLYYPDTTEIWSKRPAVSIRLKADDYGLGAYGVAGLVTCMLGLAAWKPAYLWNSVLSQGHRNITSIGAISSIMLLIPGVIATYMAAPRHPVARRLSGLPRICLLAVALMTFVIAARVAVISNSHPVSSYGMRHDWLEPTAIVAAAATLILGLRRMSSAGAVWTAPAMARIRAWQAALEIPVQLATPQASPESQELEASTVSTEPANETE